MIDPVACSRVVQAYDAQGWHRTATDTDATSARWLASEMEARGVEATVEMFAFERVDEAPCSVTGPGWKVKGHVLPDSNLEPANTVLRGTIAATPEAGEFALLRLDQHGRNAELEATRREPWMAIIAAVKGTETGLTLLNSWHYAQPFGPAVIQVPAREWPKLEAARTAGSELSISCGGTRTATGALNVVARVPGRQPSLPPVAVLTPRSGWWHCAGERGGGIAIWLEVAAEVARAGLLRDTMFVATTGHELGFLGIQRYFDAHPGDARSPAFWIHLGANIGAANSPTVVRTSDEALLALARSADLTLGAGSEWHVLAEPLGGEAQVIAGEGGRYISLVGKGFELFHSTEDRWPVGIDAAAIARNGQFVVACIRALEHRSLEQ